MRLALVTLALTAALATSARAAVTLTPAAVTVTSGATTATVTRTPFHLEIAERGRTVLAQAAPGATAPLPLLPIADPPPIGLELPPQPTLPAPLVFATGSELREQYPAGPWTANILTATRAGTMHAARDVIDAAADGDAARLTLSTTDGERRLVVRIAPAPDGAIEVSARPQPADGVIAMGDTFAAAPDEAFRGFGGRHNALDERGQDFLGWVQQQNTGPGVLSPLVSALPGFGGDRYLFPNGPAAAYYVSPSFHSSAGYAFLLERDELSRWRMASDRPDAWQVEVGAPALDYRVLPGDAERTLASLTAVTGRHRVPPAWATEPMLDRATIAFTGSAEQYRQFVRDDIANLQKYDIPISAYRIEGWELFSRDELRDVVRQLRERGIRPLFYFRAFVAKDSAGTEDPQRYDEAIAGGYVAKRADGSPYTFPGNFFGDSALIDFTNPAAVAWWRGRIREALELGAAGFMQDFGEQVLDDMVFADGRTGAQMHNAYPTLFHRVTRAVLDEWEREHPGAEPIWFFTRAGYTGSARYESANFAGDDNTDFTRSSGLASSGPDMLNRALSGAYGYGTDIGGYFDFVTPATTKELLLRWAQWAVFSPVFRLHGSVNNGTHVPWNYDAETVDVYRAISRLRYRAAPLIRALWREAARTGMPITRPLWLAAPEAPDADANSWLLGSDLLVAPVVTEGATTRAVSFPRGCWEHGETGERYDGPARSTVPAPLQRLPWFVRCGTAPLEAAAAAERRASCADRVRPVARIASARVRRGRITVRGSASDRGACRSRIVRVGVAVARVRRGRCRFLRPSLRAFTAARACARRSYLLARGRRRFTLRTARLPAGRYRAWARATDAAGNVQRTRAGRDVSNRR